MSGKRCFEFVDATSNKFWEVWVEDTRVFTRYGKIGSAGQITEKNEGSPEKAQKLHDKLVREKTGKGYVEKQGGVAQAPAAWKGGLKFFDPADEATQTAAANERLLAFTQALRDALVPRNGECLSLQGELVRANDRLGSEYFRNGMGNYYEDGVRPEDNYYGKLLLFMLGTLTENRGNALSNEDVAYFSGVRRQVEPYWKLHVRIGELEDKEEATEAELEELEELGSQAAGDDAIAWEDLFNRAERCIANWCIANSDLVDLRGQPLEERGMRNIEHIFNPPPPAPKCPLCQGRGFVEQKESSGFPQRCSCQGPDQRVMRT
jgi:predicted DNA-binding WGR domain protein